eukprot:365506-Chlamydomonas_euryale.AAC.13
MGGTRNRAAASASWNIKKPLPSASASCSGVRGDIPRQALCTTGTSALPPSTAALICKAGEEVGGQHATLNT